MLARSHHGRVSFVGVEEAQTCPNWRLQYRLVRLSSRHVCEVKNSQPLYDVRKLSMSQDLFEIKD